MKTINLYLSYLIFLIVSTVYAQITPPLPVNGWSFRGYFGNGPAATSSYLSGVAYEGNYSQAFYVSLPHGGATIEWVKNFEREYVKPTHVMYKYAYKSGNWSAPFDLKIHFYMKKGDSLYYFDASTVYKESTFFCWVSSSKSSYLGSVPNFSEIVLKFYFMPITITPIDASAEVLIDWLQLRYGNDSTITIDRFGDPLTKLDESNNIPYQFRLSQNYPNPFNPSTVISYQLSAVSHVTLKVYDLLGREVAVLVNEEKWPGNHEVRLTINDPSADGRLTSGIYFYQLKAGGFIETKKMILMK
ncbi:MAG: T9SS type A sorting domain-containing protein [Ignavibacteria bacterium]|nr:T9SS type A sorting domain-containing protein [Ignavibacteria bacterium]